MHEFQLCAFADEAGADSEAQIKALKENGIGYLELRGVGKQSIADLTPDEAKVLKRHLDKNGIKVWSIGSPVGKVQITDDFKPHLALFKHILEIAKIMEAACIRLFSFYIPRGARPEEYREEVMTRLDGFCQAAEGSGIVLCHENEKGIYGDNAARCLDILKEVRRLKGIFDPANFIQCGQEIRSAWETLAPYVYYLHVKDAREDGTVVPAGFGIGEIAYILQEYGEKQGRVLTVEPHLAVFEGLGKLENGEKSVMGTFTYESRRAAFDAAVKALKNLIE